jgi:uracil-DNA glycosylase
MHDNIVHTARNSQINMPYHDGSATGLAFGNNSYDLSPSLRNIFKEVEDDVGFKGPVKDPTLVSWAEQGVFLINTSLTVRQGNAGSHSKIGWHRFVIETIRSLNDRKDIVYLLWGRHAQDFQQNVDPVLHRVFTCSHPSPFSAHISFFGSKHFSKTNEFLESVNREPIGW